MLKGGRESEKTTEQKGGREQGTGGRQEGRLERGKEGHDGGWKDGRRLLDGEREGGGRSQGR